MHQPNVGRFPRLALSTILPLCLLAASTGFGLPANAAGERTPTPDDRDSGIKGRVVLGPLTPSSRVGESVRERPFQTTLDIVKAEDSSLVIEIRTRPNGTFSVPLPPGDYIVQPPPSDQIRRPSIDPVPVTVPPHGYVSVTINADTGMR